MDEQERAVYDLACRRARSGRPRRRVWAAVLSPDPLFCALCGEWIDKRLPRTSTAGRPAHPMSATVDHIREIADGGDPLDPDNLQPAHSLCNVRKGLRRQAERARTVYTPPTAWEPVPIVGEHP